MATLRVFRRGREAGPAESARQGSGGPCGDLGAKASTRKAGEVRGRPLGPTEKAASRRRLSFK